MRTSLALATALLLVALPRTGMAEELLDLVRAVESHYATQKDFSASFEQTVIRSHLPDRPVKKSGNVYFKKPGMMRWDYRKPDRVFYVSDGIVLWNYIPESKLAYKLKVQDSDLFYALKFLFGEGSLERDYDLSDGGREDTKRIIVVKPKLSEQNFQQLRLFVAPDSPKILETEIVDPAGNTSRLVFLKVSDQSLPDKGFTFTPPDDVQIEDLSVPQPKPE